MRWLIVTRIIGILTVSFGLMQLLPAAASLWYRDHTTVPILVSAAVTSIAGAVLYRLSGAGAADYLSQREGMAVVSVGWICLALFGALPFYLTGVLPGFTDAFFESVSGITTTGASVMTRIEGTPPAILLWRSFIQWLGGMGIIVLSIAILPFLGVGGYQLYKAEIPGPVPDKLRPRIRDTARILWKVYLLFTLAEILLLLAGGLSFFDALNHALTTMPTGGFSTRDLSVAYYNSFYVEMVIACFMLLAGINFSLHYRMLTGKPLSYLKDPECRFFLGLVLFATAVIAATNFETHYESIGSALRHAFFQVSSIITTTGYTTADFDKWPSLSRLFLLLCMFTGACAGSTGGGIKILRIMCCLKHSYRELFGLVHPHAVTFPKIGGKPVPANVMAGILGFVFLYLALFAVGSLVLASMGVDFISAVSAVAASIGNIGPGLGSVGPAANFAHINDAGKWLLSLLMLVGRLEVYTFIILFVPEFWKR